MGAVTAYSYNQILLTGQEYAIKDERVAAEAGIYPGMLLDIDSNGKFELQDASETIAPMIVAMEDDMEGKTVDDVYTISRQVQARWIPRGAQFMGYLAANHSVVIGSRLTSAGYESPGAFGLAEKSSAHLGSGVMAIALEAITTATGGLCLMQAL